MQRLAQKLAGMGMFSALENISNFMAAVQSGRWDQLPAEEQRHWLTLLRGLLGIRALGDNERLSSDQDLSDCWTIIDAQLTAVERRISRG